MLSLLRSYTRWAMAFSMENLGNLPKLPSLPQSPQQNNVQRQALPSLSPDNNASIEAFYTEQPEQANKRGKDLFVQAKDLADKLTTQGQDGGKVMAQVKNIRAKTELGEPLSTQDADFLKGVVDRVRNALGMRTSHQEEIDNIAHDILNDKHLGDEARLAKLQTTLEGLQRVMNDPRTIISDEHREVMEAKIERLQTAIKSVLADPVKRDDALGAEGAGALEDHLTHPPQDISGLSWQMKAALAVNPNTPPELFVLLAKDPDPTISRFVREALPDQLHKVMTAQVELVDGHPPVLSGQTRERLLDEGVKQLLVTCDKISNLGMFLEHGLQSLVDKSINKFMAPGDELRYQTRELFGNEQGPIAEAAREVAANANTMSDVAIKNQLALIKEARELVATQHLSPSDALEASKASQLGLPPHIDLTGVQELQERVGASNSVEQSFWVEMPDGNKALLKKSATPDMAANERLNSQLGALLDLPVNQVQLGTYNLDGKQEPVSIHHSVGANARQMWEVANEIGLNQKELSFQNKEYMTAFKEHRGRSNDYYPCDPGCSCYGRADAFQQFAKLSQRITNPEVIDRMMFFDRLTDNMDRHAGNYLVTPDGTNAQGQTMYKLHLIDHGRTLSWSQPVDVAKRVQGFRDYLDSLNDPKNACHRANVMGDIKKLAELSDHELEQKVFGGTEGLLSDDQKNQDLALLKGKRDEARAWLQAQDPHTLDMANVRARVSQRQAIQQLADQQLNQQSIRQSAQFLAHQTQQDEFSGLPNLPFNTPPLPDSLPQSQPQQLDQQQLDQMAPPIQPPTPQIQMHQPETHLETIQEEPDESPTGPSLPLTPQS